SRKRHHRFDHRHSNVLADPTIARGMKRSHDTQGGGHATNFIRQRHPDGHWLAAWSTLNRSHPGEPLDYRIVRGRIGHFSFRSEAVNRTVNDFRVYLADICVADSESVGDTGAVVLNDCVAPSREHFDQVAP